MKLSPKVKMLIPVAIVLLFTLPMGGGIWFALSLFVFIPWALYNLVRLGLKPAERKVRAVRLGIWMAVLAVAGATQGYWENALRTHADAAAASLLAYKNRTGSYPENLDGAGLSENALRDEWKIRYRLVEGKPQLYYSGSFMPLTVYEYDFETRTWKTNAY